MYMTYMYIHTLIVIILGDFGTGPEEEFELPKHIVYHSLVHYVMMSYHSMLYVAQCCLVYYVIMYYVIPCHYVIL